MLHIGYHESSSGGYMAMADEALSVGADTFAFFTRNPRGGQAKAVDEADAAAFRRFFAERQFAPLVAHAPYTMNPCSADEGLRGFAARMMREDLARMKQTPGSYYNFHPGSHVKQGADVGIALAADMLASVIPAAVEDGLLPGTVVLIETMAGKGSEIGRSFGEIRAIMDAAEQAAGMSLSDYLGVCLDTCHVWEAGYDIVSDLDGVLASFDKEIGLERLKACHLNDSLNGRGAHKDRHAKIGAGQIGFEALARVVSHPALRTLPFILETPNDHDGYAEEIARLRDAVSE
ncbi:MAG: deoxyribonuclease IV [Treponemataceae bacterium]|nr:deoxyribonuclease IV [Treponemataceae bacterium]